jgi:hypothetical protein
MKLSDTQLILLAKAAKRDDHAVELPSDIEAITAEKLVSKLAGAGLIEEIESHGAMPVWRRVDDTAFALRITDSGLKAIGIDEASTKSMKRSAPKASVKTKVAVGTKSRRVAKPAPLSKPSKPKAPKKPKKVQTTQTSTRRNSTKHDQILNLLRRKHGASLEEMQKASGWQNHSLRGYLSGTVKKRLGLKLNSSVSPNGERRYMIAAS